MALLQISEPGKTPQAPKQKLAVGIDLGTTNSLIASVNPAGKAQTLADQHGQKLLPSVVYYGAEQQILSGQAALEHSLDQPQHTVVSVKRMMGKNYAELPPNLPYQLTTLNNDTPAITVPNGQVTAVEVSADILKTLRTRLNTFSSDTLAGAVITVPAYFDDAQRQATRDAAQLAEFPYSD